MNRRDFVGYLGAGAAALGVVGKAQAQGPLPTSSRELWQLARLQPMLDSDLVWLDTAGGAPSLRSVLIEEYRQREAFSRDLERFLREQGSAEAVRQLLTPIGQFLGTDVESIALLSGATEALNTIAAGIDLAAGDEILTTVHEHPASVSPWLLAAKRRGVKLVQIPLPQPIMAPEQIVGAFRAAFTDRTRVVSFSHVQYTDGCVLPVRELCELARSHNALSIVDGAQALGMVATSLQTLGADFYVSSFYKWLNGPVGVGVLVLSPGGRFRLWPLIVGSEDDWGGPPTPATTPAPTTGQAPTTARASMAPQSPATSQATTSESAPVAPVSTLPPENAPPRAAANARAGWPMSARKFSAAFTQLSPLALSVLPAIAFQQEIGTERISARIRELAWYLRLGLQRLPGVQVLTPAHPSLWAGIVSFRIPGTDGAALAKQLAERERIAVSFVQQPSGGIEVLRACPHIYNDFADLDRLVAALRRALHA
ncbi:MAG TPA: aminotransferase class V-fold PLP-dependent enzyme [Steroidobacteraceae bacterium]|nr:aminotransferase class V-fold PLP-dependent enzyme [Steroidobacteraceae bacterium]